MLLNLRPAEWKVSATPGVRTIFYTSQNLSLRFRPAVLSTFSKFSGKILNYAERLRTLSGNSHATNYHKRTDELPFIDKKISCE